MDNETERLLIETNQRFRIATRSAKLGYWVLDLATGDVEVSEELLSQLGRDKDESWSLETWKELLHPDDLDQAVRNVEEAIDGHSDTYLNVFRLRHVDGTYRWIESMADVLQDESGKTIRMIGTHQDITHRKEIEQQLDATLRQSMAMNAALQQSNHELEQFAYVASHDLRSPLRGLQNLAIWIREDLEEADIELPTAVSNHLQLMGSQIERMQALLDGLLAFARIDMRAQEAKPVDLNEVVREAIAFVESPSGFDVQLESALPTIAGNQTPVMRVFVNLLDNAIKHHPRETGRVIISGRIVDGAAEVIVADDGDGIPEEHRERVFRMFETLGKTRADGRGGMGLAMVRKLVQSCGGTIRFEDSDLGGTAAITRWPLEG